MASYTTDWTEVTWPVGEASPVYDPVRLWIPSPGLYSAHIVANLRNINVATARTVALNIDGSNTGGAGEIQRYNSQFTIPATTSVTRTWVGNSPLYQHRFYVGGGGLLPHSSESFEYQLEIDYGYLGAVDRCAYGTHLKTTAAGAAYVTADLLGYIAIKRSQPFLRTILAQFIGVLIDTRLLCAGPPPPVPALTRDDFLFGGEDIPAPSAWGKAYQLLQALVWPEVCECIGATGGDPPAVEYDEPVVDEPDDMPAPLLAVCDEGDLCSMLDEIHGMLMGIRSQQAMLRADVTLIQRQSVPFAYLEGTVHGPLADQGELSVSAILGLSVSILSAPGWLSSTMATPPETYNYGWISVGTDEGYQPRQPIRHNPHMFLGVSGAITKVAYTFLDQVDATITELVREP